MSSVPVKHSEQWRNGWTADKPPLLDYNFIPDGTPYVLGPQAGFHYRELGVTQSSRGTLSAQLVRVIKPEAAFSDWRAYDADFHFFYIWKGHCRMENEAGQSMKLERGVAAWQPALLRHRLYDFSPDFEMFEMFGPSFPAMIVGRNTPLPERAKTLPAGRKGQYLFETPESFVQGAGPRKFFIYRDLGTRIPTEGRIHIHIVHASQAMIGTGGTGWHHHTMRQLFWVFDGSAGFTINGFKDVRRVKAGDAVCVSAGQVHDVPDMDADYKLIEVCIPADYETIDDKVPA